MGNFKNLLGNLRYRFTYRRVTSLPYDEQRKIGLKIYSDLYAGLAQSPGEATGGVTVLFQCDYDGHVAYHLENLLEKRCADEADCTVAWALERADADGDGHIGPGEYELTVVSRGEDEMTAALAAEASAMSAILKIPTVYGELKRSLFCSKQIAPAPEASGSGA